MKDIWSLSAKATPKPVRVADISGIPPTDLSSGDISLRSKRMSDVAYRWWWLRGWLKHLVGVHTYIPLEHWDWQGEVLTVTYDDEVCWFCPARRIERRR